MSVWRIREGTGNVAWLRGMLRDFGPCGCEEAKYLVFFYKM